jgi:MFS superfamily sulfate permease-like transporter
MAQWFLIVACVASGAIVLAPIAATAAPNSRPLWWRIVFAVALLCAFINLALGRSLQMAVQSTTLDREVIALMVAGVAASLVAGLAARSLRGRSRLMRVLGVLGVALACVPLGPLTLIVAHCTSGDCL